MEHSPRHTKKTCKETYEETYEEEALQQNIASTISTDGIIETLKTEVRSMHALRSFPIYVMALVCCTGVAFFEGVEIKAATSGYHIHAGVQTLLLEEEFQKVATEADLWNYMHHVTENVFRVLNNDSKVNDVPKKNVAVGFILIRQFRNQPKSCSGDGHSDFGTLSPFWKTYVEGLKCVNEAKLDSKPFGPENVWTSVGPQGLRGQSVEGQLTRFTELEKGYVFRLDLRSNLSVALETLEDRKLNGWIDPFTRASIVEVILINPTLQRFTATSLISELSATGEIVRTIDTVIFTLLSFSTHTRRFVFAMDIGMVLYLVAAVVHTLASIYLEWHLGGQRWMYTISFWDVYVIIKLCIFILAYTTRFTLWNDKQANELEQSAKEQFGGDQDAAMWQYLAEYSTMYVTASSHYSIGLLMMWLYSFYFMQFNTRLGLVTTTIKQALPTLVSMMFIYLVIIIGFSLTANILYGHDIEDFQTVLRTFSYLSRVVFSAEIDTYRQMTNSHRLLTPPLIVVFLLVTWIALFNIVLAVIAGSFQAVQESVQRKNEVLHEFEKQHSVTEDESGGNLVWKIVARLISEGNKYRHKHKYTVERHEAITQLRKCMTSGVILPQCTFEDFKRALEVNNFDVKFIRLSYLKSRAIEEAHNTSGFKMGHSMAKTILAKLDELTGGQGAHMPPQRSQTSFQMNTIPPPSAEMKKVQEQLQRIEDRLDSMADGGHLTDLGQRPTMHGMPPPPHTHEPHPTNPLLQSPMLQSPPAERNPTPRKTLFGTLPKKGSNDFDDDGGEFLSRTQRQTQNRPPPLSPRKSTLFQKGGKPLFNKPELDRFGL